jgi:hypothetical protein
MKVFKKNVILSCLMNTSGVAIHGKIPQFLKMQYNVKFYDFEDVLTYLIIFGADSFLRSCQLCSPSGTPQHFMEPEGSIPCSQEHSTGPYPETYQSNPLHPILSL